ncbi:hypothetical protein [Actinosynnema sp. NPDC023587]|uniref:hypothetical protein n=1 Tax=Actinosynnema sp. NPDC023587 TaxID=3154695 RepID=UPI0033F24F3B
MVHTVAGGRRVLEAVEVIESDPRVQITFCRAPDAFSSGVDEFLRGTRGVVLPWEQATRERFDLALAASHGSVHLLHAPLLLVPHGADCGDSGSAGGSSQVCDPAAPDGEVVAGDLWYDRMVASLPRRPDYRAALGVSPQERLVVVASTWGPDSLLARFEDLVPRLLDELSGHGVRVASLVHPAAWSAHGVRQVRAWLADCRDAGLILVEPEVDWRVAVVAADHVIADHGSVGVYSAALGTPVLLAGPAADVRTCAALGDGSARELLRRHAPRLTSDRSVVAQLEDAARGAGALAERVRDSLAARPGRAAIELRRAAYRLLHLLEPRRYRPPVPVPVSGSPSA